MFGNGHFLRCLTCISCCCGYFSHIPMENKSFSKYQAQMSKYKKLFIISVSCSSYSPIFFVSFSVKCWFFFSQAATLSFYAHFRLRTCFIVLNFQMAPHRIILSQCFMSLQDCQAESCFQYVHLIICHVEFGSRLIRNVSDFNRLFRAHIKTKCLNEFRACT